MQYAIYTSEILLLVISNCVLALLINFLCYKWICCWNLWYVHRIAGEWGSGGHFYAVLNIDSNLYWV